MTGECGSGRSKRIPFANRNWGPGTLVHVEFLQRARERGIECRPEVYFKSVHLRADVALMRDGEIGMLVECKGPFNPKYERVPWIFSKQGKKYQALGYPFRLCRSPEQIDGILDAFENGIE